MYESDDEQSKTEFYYLKAITTRKTTLKMTILCHAIYVYIYIYIYIYIRENIGPRSFTYVPRPTGSFRTVKTSV